MSIPGSLRDKRQNHRNIRSQLWIVQLAGLAVLALAASLPVSAAGVPSPLEQARMLVPTVVLSTATASATRVAGTGTNTPAASSTPTWTFTPTQTLPAAQTSTATLTPLSTPTHVASATPTNVPTATPTVRATPTSARLLPTATSIYGDPYGSNTWANFLASLTPQAAYYATAAAAGATPTVAASASYTTPTATPSAPSLTLSVSATSVRGATLSSSAAAGLSAGPVPQGGPSPQLNPVPLAGPTMIAMAPDARLVPPAGDVQPELLVGVKADSMDQTIPVDQAYYARRLQVITDLGSVLLFLAGAALGTLALVRFVLVQMDR